MVFASYMRGDLVLCKREQEAGNGLDVYFRHGRLDGDAVRARKSDEHKTRVWRGIISDTADAMATIAEP